MPKRRVTTAKQRAASRRNLENARRGKQTELVHPGTGKKFNMTTFQGLKVPHGKTRLLVHHTNVAGAVVKQGFKDRSGNKAPGRAHFTDWARRKSYAGFGNPVSVKVPRRIVAKDTHPLTLRGRRVTEHSLTGAVTVAVKDLKGRKIRRVL